MSLLKQQIGVIDNDYLIEIANKGIVNRALKELPDCGITVTLNEAGDELNATFADGTTVKIKDSIDGFDCSCPSRTICKHVIAALLSAPKPEGGICSSSERILTTAKPEKPVAKPKERVLDVTIIPTVTEFVCEILKTGLFRLPPDYSVKCTQLATLCHGAGFASFERLFEACAKELELYERKSAAFNKNKLMKSLARLCRLCKSENLSEAAGVFKQKYTELPQCRLYGIGGYRWQAKTGFVGVTSLYYCPKQKRTLTLTNSRPAETMRNVENEINSMLRSPPWNTPVGFDNLSKSELAVNNAKVSADCRLSSSESTIATIIRPATRLGCDELSGIVTDDFSTLKSLFEFESEESKSVYAVLKSPRIEGSRYDEVKQAYYADLLDSDSRSLTMSVRFSPFTKSGIMNLEALVEDTEFPLDAITVILSVSEDRLEVEVFPVAVWTNGKIKNIFNEQLYPKKEKSNRFSKFFKEG
jgi:hypothetical protein